jgi:hypothetical protein
VTGLWFTPGTPVSFTNKTDRHNITEILLKVALSTIKPKPNILFRLFCILFTVRLMRGNYRSNGMVEVYHKSKGWSTVCTNGFGQTEAGNNT